MSRDPAYLLDILNSARLVLEFVQGVDRAEFDRDTMRQYAVVHGIMIIGEAARRISQEFRGEHPELPWQNMIGMRSRIIHNYDEIDLDIVWRVVEGEIPKLISLIEPLVPPDEEPEP
jgi:uncharacterized protein with HEPN domain